MQKNVAQYNEKMPKIIIFDETNGKSAKGKSMKWIAEKYGIPYVTNNKDLMHKIGKK